MYKEDAMEYRAFRNTGLKTSLLGFGCMRFPTLSDYKTIDLEQTRQMVALALERGVNYFDTAYVYQNGASERTIGAILRDYPRERFFLTDKMPNWLCKSEGDVRRIFSESLERCGVDYFDFYLCHNVSGDNIDFYTGDNCVIPVLEEYKAQGKIRYLGFSSHGKPEDLRRMLAVRDWDFVQIQLNYLDWTYQDAKQQYEILTEAGIPVMVMEPVRGGRLADLGTLAAPLEAYAPGASQASWALRWVASLPGIQVVLSGMSSMAQVADNLATFGKLRPITEREKEILAGVAQALQSQSLIPCTGCRYCAGCPQELDIPRLLGIWGDYILSRNPFSLTDLDDLPADKRPDMCIGCGSCMEHCPQHIRIPELLVSLDQAYKVRVQPR